MILSKSTDAWAEKFGVEEEEMRREIDSLAPKTCQKWCEDIYNCKYSEKTIKNDKDSDSKMYKKCLVQESY